MIEGYLPGVVRVDPVGVAPAEVVALAARCELLEAALEQIAAMRTVFRAVMTDVGPLTRADGGTLAQAAELALAALVAAGATGKAGT